jgi:hypothetical protein
MDLLWLAVLIQTVYFIVNRAYALIILFILLSLGLQLWKKTSVVYLLIPMLICQIVFFVWRQRLGKTRETFLFKKKFKFPSVKVPSSINAASASILGKNKALETEKKALETEKKALETENKALEDKNDDLEKKIEYTNDALSS